MTIANGVEKTRARNARIAQQGDSKEPIRFAPAQVPIAPVGPILDLPVGGGSPQRGTFPAATVLASDLSDSTRAFRQAGMRSAVFPYPTLPQNTGSSLVATIQAKVTEAQTESVIAGQKASAASNAASSASSAASTANANASTALATAGTAQTTANTAQTTATNAQATANNAAPLNFSGTFTYSATSTSITWSWVGMVILEADGNVVTVPNGTQAITGLIASTTYYFYPTYDEGTSTLLFIAATNLSTPFPALVGVTGDGSSGYISTATQVAAILSNYTVEFWFKQSSNAASGLVEFNSTHTATPGTTFGPSVYMSTLNGGTIAYYTKLATSSNGTIGNLNNGEWHHVVMQFTGTHVSSYVDGSPDLASTALVAPSAFNGYWRMFNTGVVNTEFFGGTISNVAVYPSLLTETQIQYHYSLMVNSGQTAYVTQVVMDSPTYFWTLSDSGSTYSETISGTNTGSGNGTLTDGTSQSVIQPVGSPAEAWLNTYGQVAQAQNASGFFGLSSGAMQAATPATGSSGGSGGGSAGAGSGVCFTPNTMVKTKRGDIAFKDVQIGDFVLTARKTWREVTRLEIHKHSGPMFSVRDGAVTPTHKLLINGLWTDAKNALKTWFQYDGSVYNCEVDTDAADDGGAADTEHSYTLASGLVAHNIPFQKIVVWGVLLLGMLHRFLV